MSRLESTAYRTAYRSNPPPSSTTLLLIGVSAPRWRHCQHLLPPFSTLSQLQWTDRTSSSSTTTAGDSVYDTSRLFSPSLMEARGLDFCVGRRCGVVYLPSLEGWTLTSDRRAAGGRPEERSLWTLRTRLAKAAGSGPHHSNDSRGGGGGGVQVVLVVVLDRSVEPSLPTLTALNLVVAEMRATLLIAWGRHEAASVIEGLGESGWILSSGSSRLRSGPAEEEEDAEPVPVLIEAFTESPALLQRMDVVRLSSTYHSVAEMLLSMGADERMQRLPGIGPKKARRVAAVLRAPFPTRERRLDSFFGAEQQQQNHVSTVGDRGEMLTSTVVDTGQRLISVGPSTETQFSSSAGVVPTSHPDDTSHHTVAHPRGTEHAPVSLPLRDEVLVEEDDDVQFVSCTPAPPAASPSQLLMGPPPPPPAPVLSSSTASPSSADCPSLHAVLEHALRQTNDPAAATEVLKSVAVTTRPPPPPPPSLSSLLPPAKGMFGAHRPNTVHSTEFAKAMEALRNRDELEED